jgi:hypothetical protein
MRLILEGEQLKIQNFVEYLIEYYNEKGKTYEFEIHIEDKYDKKFFENRESSLKDKILILHTDGFEIIHSEFLKNVNSFKEEVKELLGDEGITKDITEENFDNQFVHYKLGFVDQDQKHQFDFSFINLSK